MNYSLALMDKPTDTMPCLERLEELLMRARDISKRLDEHERIW